MNKTLILISCLLVFALAEDISMEGEPILLGGYNTLSKQDLAENNELPQIEAFARNQYALKNNGVFLGELKSVRTQVVAGINYKLVFASDNGDVEIIVWDQSWTETR